MSKQNRAQKPPQDDEEPSVLQAFLDKHGLSQEDFAERFDPKVSQGLIWQWLEWLKNPEKGTRITAERAKEIETLTGGDVPKYSLRPDVYEAPQERAST